MTPRYTLITLTAFLVLAWAGAASAQTFQLEQDDTICILGNTLAERMQHDGWLETHLHARYPEHEVVIRNLGFSGDEIDTRLRSMNFGTPDEWLYAEAEAIGGYEENRLEGIHDGADVIFAFFGYNESFAGEDGLQDFKRDLSGWMEHTLGQHYNGESPPRIVLFSPIAHEDLGDPLLPDGTENNQRLELYTQAMSEVAAEHDVFFVDLFSPSRHLYEETDAPLTINGIHLNEEANRKIAEVIHEELFGEPPAYDAEYLDKLNEAVLDKNFHWFHRYRTPDGYSTFGERAFLPFYPEDPDEVDPDLLDDEGLLPSNYVVLQRELQVLDVKTRNRDERIHAVAQGSDLEVDDSNVPPFLDAGTNRPGPGADGEYPFLGGEEAIDKITTASGLQVELFASEEDFPELINPVQMAFDTQGRLWVATWTNYAHWQPGTPMDDRLLIFEDTNGDGRADNMTVFADSLHNPTGFEFYNGGVIVAQQPDLLFLKDTTGNDRYDVKKTLLHGFDSADTHHAINSFTFDPGGALYMQEGLFHHSQIESPYGPPTRLIDGGVFRFEPRAWDIEVYSPINFPNPHGHVFDRWGRNVVMDATMGVPFYGPAISSKLYFPDRQPGGAPSIYDPRTRPVASIEMLSSRHFPEHLNGNLLVLNVITTHGILNYNVSDDGAGLAGEEDELFLESSDLNFRPSDAEVAPDGSLYFLDWHNPLIGHMQHNLRDNSRDNKHGRIYRVTYPDRPLLEPVSIAGEPIEHLLDLLKEPEDRVRYRTRIELGSRDSDEVIGALQQWIDNLDADHEDYEHHRAEALWVHQWHYRVNEDLLRQQLESDEPRARAAATRVLARWRDEVNAPLELLEERVNDEHPAVRLEAVRALSFFQTPEAFDIAQQAEDHENDTFLEHVIEQTLGTLERFRE